MVDLSIIVPVYNVRDYLEECIDSILSIKNLSIEVICIEDVSTDGSKEILIKKYSNIDNVKIYSNKKNRGLAFSRNVGLKYSSGEFIMFVDSDDYINSLEIEQIIKKMRENDLDILYFDVKEICNCLGQENSDKRIRHGDYNDGTGATMFDKFMDEGEMFGCVWDGIYKRKFLSEHDIQFIDGILHEDIPFTFKALLTAKKVSVEKKIVYYYRQRNNSILHQCNYLKRAEGLIVGYFQIMLTYHLLRQNIEMQNIRANVERYVDSIVSMIESNLEKSQKLKKEDSIIISSFFQNFDISKDRRLNKLKQEGIIDKLKNYKNIGFYGAGKIAHMVLPVFLKEKIDVSEVLVSDIKKNKNQLFGLKVIQANPMILNNYQVIVIGVGVPIKYEIIKYLGENNYKGIVIELPEV